jgi:trans-AT polyketide synthase, acyltransferase and oxidoreductase domains
MTTYVFPGQGSQAKGMGAEFFTEFPDYVLKADRVLGYSIQKLCLEDPDQLLNRTDYTQPALYVVSVLSYLKKLKDGGKTPDYVAGHSLGEYNALFAAEAFDFETGLKLVIKRGALMNQATGGGMAAVVGLTSDDVQAVLKKNNLTNIVIANYNSAKQVIISGQKNEVNAAEPLFINAGAMLFMPLKVSGAFHSPYMEKAQQEFAIFIRDFNFSPLKIPVMANVNAKPYRDNEIQSNLVKQITHSVQWTQSIDYLITQGETKFEEIGPGKVLSGLITRIQKGQ